MKIPPECPCCDYSNHEDTWKVVTRTLDQRFFTKELKVTAEVMQCENCGFPILTDEQADHLLHHTKKAYEIAAALDAVDAIADRARKYLETHPPKSVETEAERTENTMGAFIAQNSPPVIVTHETPEGIRCARSFVPMILDQLRDAAHEMGFTLTPRQFDHRLPFNPLELSELLEIARVAISKDSQTLEQELDLSHNYMGDLYSKIEDWMSERRQS